MIKKLIKCICDSLSHESLNTRKPVTSWLVKPADWKGSHLVTVFWEDLPEKCFDCGACTLKTDSDFVNIEGYMQPMRVTYVCPNGCGRTDWLA